MELRFAKPTDQPTLYAIWQEAFGDDIQTIDAFFSTCFSLENTLVAAQDGVPVSVLYLLPATLQMQETAYSAAYIYAAATAQTARGQGVMTALLTFAETVAKQRQIDCLFLVPADAHLRAYYGQRGFQSAFSNAVWTLSAAEANCHAASDVPLLPVTAENWQRVRAQVLRETVHMAWPQAVLTLALDFFKRFGQTLLLTEQGFAVCASGKDGVTVSEFCCNPAGTAALLGALVQAFPSTKYTLCAPVHHALPQGAELQPTAMLSPVSARAHKLRPVENAYIGVTLG